MKIGLRLALSFSLILVFMLAIILGSLNQIKVSQAMFNRIIKVNNVRLQQANTMIDNTREVSIALRNILLLKESEKTLELKNRIDSIRNQYDEDFNKLEVLIRSDDTVSFDLVTKIKASQTASRLLSNKIVDLVMAGKHEDAISLMNQQASKSVAIWINDIDELITHNKNRSNMLYLEAERVQTAARSFMLILGALAILLAVVISILMTLSITKPLNISLMAANMIASKDLSKVLSSNEKRRDEFGDMTQSFDRMTEALREQIQEILNGVNVIASTSSEILASTTQIASGSAETAAAISETTTTVEEVRQAALLSSQKANNLSDNAKRVAQVSQNGQKAVEETLEGMNHIRKQMDEIAQTVIRLSEQSQSIGGIIASVTDLADQSNLLAVNAAIEAARAGEQGKGFAVVAQEIRNLAEQSKQATMQVRNILNEVQKATGAAVLATEQGNKAVEEGVKKSEQAGEAIRILTESSGEAVQVSTQIVASSQQQLVGMDQIGTAMQNINQAGIETAASMTQAEESVKNLHELGQKLKVLVERFKM
ncbi:MAG: HAMP domain-containing methyl-accepting chemotaxis protein [Bacteroidales bacterium]